MQTVDPSNGMIGIANQVFYFINFDNSTTRTVDMMAIHKHHNYHSSFVLYQVNVDMPSKVSYIGLIIIRN